MVDKEEIACIWDVSTVLAEKIKWDKRAMEMTVKLLDEGNTVPFIARYRKEKTNNMDAATLRNVQDQYEELKAVQTKVVSVVKNIEKQGKLTPSLKTAICAAQTPTEIEHLYTPYKMTAKKTLADRARDLGLEPMACDILDGKPFDMNRAVNVHKQGVENIAEVRTGLQHIIADKISKDVETLALIRRLCTNEDITITSTRKKESAAKKVASAKPQPTAAKAAEAASTYFNFEAKIRLIQSYQILAMNRGEASKLLVVKVVLPLAVKSQYIWHCRRKWVKNGGGRGGTVASEIVEASIADAYDRLLEPLMMRQIRSELTKLAEKSSVRVFSANLKQLLLTPPLRGKAICGLDPGFKNGCKFALIHTTGKVLTAGVVYLHTKAPNELSKELEKLRKAILEHRCETVAIGNGVACRETETHLSDAIHRGLFRPLNLRYCIVSEAGASIYSASGKADEELPDMDVSLRGAVSIARRLQDPLAELVKIEAKHIGVGMYQHDISQSILRTALDGVVEDCVSFVGVDVNTCSDTLLQHIAGVGATKARNLIAYRDTHGGFTCREELRHVKGLGPKSFEQCAGFIRVMRTEREATCDGGEIEDNAEDAEIKNGQKRKLSTVQPKSKKARIDSKREFKVDEFDMTSLHPESYHVANRFLVKIGSKKAIVGTREFVDTLRRTLQPLDLASLAADLGTSASILQCIVDALSEPVDHDIRTKFERPLFRSSILKMEDLKPGSRLSGQVRNVTDFGAFVDVGVGRDGLVLDAHTRRLGISLAVGDRVEVLVRYVDLAKNRIGLDLDLEQRCETTEERDTGRIGRKEIRK